MQKCREQLQRLSEALGNYRQDHKGSFPASLGELLPKYVSDPSLLRCPAALEHGRAGTANPGLIVPGEEDGKVVGYTWEMTTNVNYWAGTSFGLSFSRFKDLQRRSVIGKYVPVIRCTHHGDGHVLNLTEDGTIYESGDYWESNFVDIIPVVRFDPALVERSDQKMSALLRPRPTGVSEAMLNLREWCNARFEDPWVIGDLEMEQLQPDSELLGSGWITNRGVTFDAAGIIQLNGRIIQGDVWEGYSSLMYPTAVKSITIKRSFRVMHVLGAVQFNDPIGTSVGKVELHRTGVPPEKWTWRYGVDVLNYRFTPGASEPRLESTTVAWTGGFTGAKAQKEKPRLFHMQFVTTKPDVVVDHVDFLAGEGASSPFIAAITLE